MNRRLRLVVLVLIAFLVTAGLIWLWKPGETRVVLAEAEGVYFILPRPAVALPSEAPSEVENVTLCLLQRLASLSSYVAEVSIQPGVPVQKYQCYIDLENGRARQDIIYGAHELNDVMIYANDSCYYYRPHCGVAVRSGFNFSLRGWIIPEFGPNSTYLGLEDENGEECFLVSDYSMGTETTYWFSRETGLTVKSEMKFSVTNQTCSFTYRYTELNGTLEDALFTLPGGVMVMEAVEAEGEDRVCFSVPIHTESQIPLLVHVETDPPTCLADYRLSPSVGMNQIMEVRLHPIRAGEVIKLHWRAYALLGAKDYSALPEGAPIPQTLSPELQRWVDPQPSMQSDADMILEKAAVLAAGDKSVLQVAEAVLDFMKELRPRGGPQDALTTLKTMGGVCNGHATLSCALLRASGIPTRVLAVLPLGVQVLTHYLVEFYAPDFGWVWLEPSFMSLPHQPSEDVVLGVLYPEDDRGIGGLERVAYTSSDLVLLTYDPESQEVEGQTAEALRSFSGSWEEVSHACAETIKLWQDYESNVDPKSPQEKDLIYQALGEGLRGIRGSSIGAYLEALDELRSLYGPG